MKPSVILTARVLPRTAPLMKQKNADIFSRTYEDGKCHVTSVNACTNEVNVMKLTPMKNFVSCQTPKLFPLPLDAISGLKTALADCKKAAKIVQHEADQLSQKLNQRRFPASPKEVQAARKKIISKLKLDDDSSTYLSSEYFSQKIQNAQEKYVNREVHKQLKKTRYNWKPLDFKTKEDAAVFSLSQMAPYFAEARKVLNEFKRIDFKPETVLDYGSGCGSVFWAVRDFWPDLGEYSLVDINDSISQFAMDVMRDATESQDSVPKNVYFRRALVPSLQKKYDLVIAHRLLIEIGSHEQRLDIISQLWNRTKRFLVIIESSLEDSFEALMQARNFILTNGVKMDSNALKELLIAQGIYTDEIEQIIKNKQMSYSEKFLLLHEKLPNPEKLPTFIETGRVFAPCPHDGGCPLLDLPIGRRSCKFFARYNEIRADEKLKNRSSDGTGMSSFSYCIMEKGVSQEKTAGRLLDRSKSSGCVSCKVCTPFDGVQRFPLSKRAGPLYQLAKSSVPGQLFPIEAEVIASDSDYHIVREMLKEELESMKK